MGDLRDLCGQCGLDTRGSRMDIVTRLQKEMQSRATYDKVFSKIWGASGGWAVVTCPCAIVYGVKFNVRAESPRDFTDLLLSMKHLPNITLYDFARGLATHANQRVANTFRPHGGRLLEPTEENIERANAGEVSVSMPWLHSKKAVPDVEGHPVTGCADHYVLYDRFHEANTKDKTDVLRKLELSPDLCGWVNSQAAEQLFSGMKQNNHFLNMMSPSSHVFLMRSILHHHNDNKNKAAMDKLEKAHGQKIILNSCGQAVLEGTQSTGSHTEGSDNADTVVDKVEEINDVMAGRGQTSQDVSDAGCHTTEISDVMAGRGQTSQDVSDAGCHITEINDVMAGRGQTSQDVSDAGCHTTGMARGRHCAKHTSVGSVQAKRSCWSFPVHADQERVLQYVLDTSRPAHELIVRDHTICLTRSDFFTLGLSREMESTIGNACLNIVRRVAISKRKNIHISDLYLCPTWLPPLSRDPMAKIPSQAHELDALFLPLWTPGHYQICVIKPAHKQILLLDSLFAESESGFKGQQYIPLMRNIAQNISSGPWEEITGKDVQGFPSQTMGVDCGIFMIMAALYVTLDGKFDYSIHDMPALRRWWCLLLLENNTLDSHGQVFAHWTEECQDLLSGMHRPVFRLKRKRGQDSEVPSPPAKRHVPAHILELPEDILHRILLQIVIEDGDVAIWRLALTCKKFQECVCKPRFQMKAHFSWLDSVVAWNKRPPLHQRQYRRPYKIEECRRPICRGLYKDCGAGYRGNGVRGVLQAFYSTVPFPGYCSWECFEGDGGLD